MRPRPAALALGVLVLAATSPEARAGVCDPDALCPDPAAPCVIAGTTNLTDGCLLDFGARTVTLAGILKSEVSGGSFTIRAGAFAIDGGALKAVGSGTDPGGTITLDLAGEFRMDPSGPRINVNGAKNGGTVIVQAGTIDVAAGAPAISADGTTADADGGTIMLDATGTLRIDGTVRATGGSASGGGSITLMGATVQLESALNVTGGGLDGGEVNVVATAGDVAMTGSASIVANGGRSDEIGSDGGLVDLDAIDGDVIAGDIVADGAGPDGFGGALDVTASGDAQVLARLSVQGPGLDSSGGSVFFDTGGALLVDAVVDASGGGDDLGGDVTFAVGGALTIAAGGVVRVSAGIAAGEILSFSSPGALVVDGTLDARGTGGGRGGTINLGPHCQATVRGTLDARGSFGGSGGDTTIVAGSITVTDTGQILATPCADATCGNALGVESGAPSIDPGASVDPPPAVTTSPGLLACCGDGTLDAGEACDDGNRLHCDGCGPTCAVEPQPACPDGGNPCVTVACDPARGCLTTPLTGLPCPDDGNTCTSDRCAAGVCRHQALDCDDGIACTLDACDPVLGCVSTPQDAACDDANPCTADRCDAALGCVQTPLADGSACDDASVCTVREQCAGGLCVPGASLVCDDGDPCTTDQCNPSLGCLAIEDPALCPCLAAGGPKAAGTACADGDNCTVGDVCDGAGACVPGAPRSCDDGDPCTTDTCAFGLCLYADTACPQSCDGLPDGTPCSDGAICTTGTCQGGSCASVPSLCEDGDPCTGEEFCSPLFGCRRSFPPEGIPCEDGDVCTVGDTCAGGTCVAGAASPCAACERCDPQLGCRIGPLATCRPSRKPGKSTLLVRDASNDAKDLLKWKWVAGDATLEEIGDPFTEDATLCVFDASDALLLRANAPAGGTCGTTPCWKARADGFKYRDRERTPDGIDKILLRAGSDGRAKIVLKAKGETLSPPPPPLDVPVVVQFHAPGEQCFETRYEPGGVRRNDLGLFKGGGSP